MLSTKAMAGDKFLRDLRRLSEVTIPEGVERVGDHWFSCSDIESVTIPKSVRAIGKYAFCECRRLKKVLF